MAATGSSKSVLGRGLPGRAIRASLSLAIVAALVTAFESLNFFFYFTVLSNVLAAVLFAGLAMRPEWESSNARFRGAVTLYMVITGLVYAVLLRPIEADVVAWSDGVSHMTPPVSRRRAASGVGRSHRALIDRPSRLQVLGGQHPVVGWGLPRRREGQVSQGPSVLAGGKRRWPSPDGRRQHRPAGTARAVNVPLPAGKVHQ